MFHQNSWSTNSEPLIFSNTRSKISKYYWLIFVAMVTIILWRIKYGDYILYPFTLVSTFVHELGHGLSAKIVGFYFEKLEMSSDGSGIAIFYHPEDASRLDLAFVSFMGPMSGPFLGSIFIILRSFNLTSKVLYFFIFVLMLTGMLYIGNFFGYFFIISMIIILVLVLKMNPIIQTFFVDMLGTQICIGIYHDLEYLYTYEVEAMNGKMILSDTGAIQRVLILPHWFWATFMLVVSTLMLLGSLWISFKKSNHEDSDF
jgi:hypothetical protein